MKLPLIFAVGPTPVIIVCFGIAWMLFAFGAPAFSRALTKRKKKIPAVVVGVLATCLTGFVTFSDELRHGPAFFFLLFGALPFALSVFTLAVALRLRSSPSDEEKA